MEDMKGREEIDASIGVYIEEFLEAAEKLGL